MWKSIRSLFFQDGGSNEPEDHAADTMLGQLWISLVRLGMARGLTLQDAEDLAQESIVAGMEYFDPARGDFCALCKTIMANKTKNHHRDKKPQEPLPEDGGAFRNSGDGAGWASYHRQCRERSDRILADTISSLEEEEVGFFMILAEVHEDLSHGEVSEAARRAGVTPQKGWDIFRKIQRRFKDLDRSIILPERPPERAFDPSTRFALSSRVPHTFSETHSTTPSDIPGSERQLLGHLSGEYHRFSSDLGSDSRRRLHSLLRH